MLTVPQRRRTLRNMSEVKKGQKGWYEGMKDDPVWSKVIANFYWAILVGIAGGLLYYLHGWPVVGAWIASTWTSTWLWVKTGGHFPGWAVLLLSLGSGGFIFLLVVLALVARRAALNKVKTELNFMGLIWRWRIRRHVDRDEMVNVLPFCPICEMQLHPTRVRDVPRNHTKYFCDRCPGRPERLTFEGEPDDVEDLVVREAQRQMRLGILGKTTETHPPSTPTPQLGEVQETLFEGLRWRWRFRVGELVNIETYCPACDAPLPPSQENPDCPTLYNCRSCRAQIKVFVGIHDELQARFVRCVQREARGG